MTQNNLKIAITGGIGSGKSTVANLIREQGYTVFSCDEIYAELLNNADFINKLAQAFEGVINADSSLNRAELSKRVFSNEEQLAKLNEITHPAIMHSAFSKMEGYPISFLEVPLLFENSFESLFDSVIVVLRERKERVKSIIVRDKLTYDEADLRIKSQINYDKFDFTEYYVIHNCSNLQDLKSKTVEILDKLLSLKNN